MRQTAVRGLHLYHHILHPSSWSDYLSRIFAGWKGLSSWKGDRNEYPLVPVQPAAKAEVTHSVIEIPKPRDQSPPPEDTDCEQIEIKEIACTLTPVYQ